jgi:4-amino-4-deoxy-L-arabinose transferase-like glycosyltransferase
MPMSTPASIPDTRRTCTRLRPADWAVLIALLALATLLRFAFFNGPYGSDDLIYLDRSVQIAQGDWRSANYNGALRYGFNIPAGFFIYLFGINIVAANLWPLICSIAEVAAVYLLAFHLWGRRAALYGALILAFLPLHVVSATRIHADPVVAFFLTLSFVSFYFSEHYRSRLLCFFTGIAMGLVFWTKELAVMALLAFVVYPVVWRKIEARWVHVIGGALVMLLSHFALMSLVAGDPLHAIKVVSRQVSHSFIQGGDVAEDGIWFYFNYLFLDIKHIWLAGFIATASIVLTLHRRLRSRPVDAGTAYVSFWLLALIGILSFMPVSLEPLKFVMKQSNYLTLFLAPIALLSGHYIAHVDNKSALALLVTTIAGGFFLAALEQQAYHVFTSNSKAALDFATRNPGMPIIGSSNNGNISAFYSTLKRHPSGTDRFLYIDEIPHRPHRHAPPAHAGIRPAYAILDGETMGWGKHDITFATPPACWKYVEQLVPTGFGFGKSLTEILTMPVEMSPDIIRNSLKPRLAQLFQPSSAAVYRVDINDFWCEQGSPGMP